MIKKISITAGAAYILTVLFIISSPSEERVKNIILIIGDGMGVQEIGFFNSYVKYAPESIYRKTGRTSSLESIIRESSSGLVFTETYENLVTDSAASSTMLATGKFSRVGMIGADYRGNRAMNLVEKAEKAGMSTGLVSDTRITHATPAGFVSHQPVRSRENEIAVDLLNSGVDVMLSGGLRHWLPRDVNGMNSKISEKIRKRTGGRIKIKSKRMDSRNLLDEAEKKGYRLVFSKQELEEISGGMVLGLFSDSGMPDAFSEKASRDNSRRSLPLLSDMAEAALKILGKNEKGFFLMIEAGQIDWASHGNDAGWLLQEMIRLDEVLKTVRRWTAGRKDTLVVVTADHETGGPGFSYSANGERIERKLFGDLFKKRKYIAKSNFGSPSILDRLYMQKMSYRALFERYDSLPHGKKGPAMLAKTINSGTRFPVTREDAGRILGLPDESGVRGIHDFREFYLSPEENRSCILARVVAGGQNMVWSTGAHTSSPVPFFVWGPERERKKFHSCMHMTELGQIIAGFIY